MTKFIVDYCIHNQTVTDFAALKAAGITAVFRRVTLGSDIEEDGSPWPDRVRAKAAGVDFGIYHFLYHDNISPINELNWFLKIAGAIPNDVAVMLDVEEEGNPTAADMYGWLDGWFAHYPNHLVIVYGSKGKWLSIGSPSLAKYGGKVLHWPAAYWYYSQPPLPAATIWAMTPDKTGDQCLQFTNCADVPGMSTNHVDCSAWLGTEEQYKALFGQVATEGDSMFIRKAEGWKTVPGTPYFDSVSGQTPGKQLGVFNSGVALTSIGQSMDGFWRLCAISGSAGVNPRWVYIRKSALVPIATADAAFDKAVQDLLLSRKAPVAPTQEEIDQKVLAAVTADRLKAHVTWE